MALLARGGGQDLAGDQSLELFALAPRQWHHVVRPRIDKWVLAGDAVGKMRDGERIGIGVVVALDHVEILEHEESGTSAARRQIEARFLGRTRKGLTIGALKAQLGPGS